MPGAIKRLRGSEQRYVNDHEPQFPAPASLYAPRYLSKTAQGLWRRYGHLLVDRGVLRESDVAAFEALCLAYGTMVDAARILKREGLTTVDERGLPRKHPAYQIMRESSMQLKSYCALFGLSPSDRQRLVIEPLDGEPNLAELLFAGFDGDRADG